MPFSLRLRQDPVYASESSEPGPADAGPADAQAKTGDGSGSGADGSAAAGEVAGLRLDFERRGSSGTSAERDTKKPAKLEWIGRFTNSVRDQPEPKEMPLGELRGELELEGSPLGPVFTCDADSLQKLTEEPEEENAPDDDDDAPPYFVPHALTLEFGETITGLDVLDEKQARLNLPPEAGRFRYLEVCVRLSVAGSSESDLDQNDILDVLLRPAPRPGYPFSL